ITDTLFVGTQDTLARHKTLNYWQKRIAHADAVARGSDDALCVTNGGLICETTRANIFFIERRRLITPSLDGPLLPGVMRGLVLEIAARTGVEGDEMPMPLECVKRADEAFLTSSLRGLVPIARLLDRDFSAPGPVTDFLGRSVLRWLKSGETR